MYKQADKTEESKSPSAANSSSQKGSSKPAFKMVDNRPEALAQRKLQDIANSDVGVTQLVRSGNPEQEERDHPGTKEDSSKFYTDSGTGPFDNRLAARMAENKEKQAADPIAAAMKKWSDDKSSYDSTSRISTPSQSWAYTATFVWNNVNGYEIKAHVHYTEIKEAHSESAAASSAGIQKRYSKSIGHVWGQAIGEQGTTPHWVVSMAPDNPADLPEYGKTESE